MKIRLTTTAALVFLILAGFQAGAQTNSKSKGMDDKRVFHFGVKADLNLTGIRGNGMDTKFGTGVEGGVFGEWKFCNNQNWSLQPEILFTQSNTKRSDDFMTYYVSTGKRNGNESIKLTYLCVPVLVKYNLNKWFSVLAGPQYNFMVFDNDDLLISGKDAFKSSEFSGNVGAQFNVSAVSIYGRYNFGLSNINDIDSRYAWHSSHIQVGVAVRIK